MMYCVGLTGNIASGKSTVATFFKALGITVISADKIARELTRLGQPALHSIAQHFGKSVLSTSGELDRGALRQKIFIDPQQRLWLERLLHPLIRQAIQSKINESSSNYCLIEIPLLNNRLDYPYLDRVLLVLANREQQIIRVILRDNCTREQALAILATQSDDESKQKIADDILMNNGSIAELTKKIEKLHDQYLQLASQKS